MQIKKRTVIAVILTIFSLVLMKKFYLIAKPFLVEVKFKNGINSSVSVDLNRKNNFEFRKIKSEIKNLATNESLSEKFEINIQSPKRLRLSFFNLKNKNKIEIEEIKIQNKNIKLSNDDFILYGAEFDKAMNGFVIKPQDDVFKLVYKNKIGFVFCYDFEIEIFIIILILSYLFSYKIVDYLADFKTAKDKSRIEIGFLILFFFFLCVPSLYINNEEISEKENRVLAKWKPLITNNGEINLNFGKDFEAWFSDRFFQRDDFINLYYKQFLISKNLRTNKVIKGKENWLFYGIPAAVNMYTNKNLFTEEGLEKLKNRLVELDEYCKKNNKQFYFMIAPSKPMIYSEFYSDLIKPDKSSKVSCAEQIIEYLKKNSDVKVIYPKENLMKNKDKGLLYFKTDTHWNELGAYYGYETMMQALNSDKKLKPFKMTKTQKVLEKAGDLDKNLPKILKTKVFEEYNKPLVAENKYSCQKTAAQTDVQYCESNNGDKKLLMFRDSFTINLIPYLASTFKKSIYVWKYDVDFSVMQDADVVILEIVEVSLPDLVEKKMVEK